MVWTSGTVSDSSQARRSPDPASHAPGSPSAARKKKAICKLGAKICKLARGIALKINYKQLMQKFEN